MAFATNTENMSDIRKKLKIKGVFPNYTSFLSDESHLHGEAETMNFPITEEEIRLTLSYFEREGIPVTIQGGRTGITGGSVPFGGHILNLNRFTRVLGIRFDDSLKRYAFRLQPGLLLESFNSILNSGKLDTKNWDRESIEVWQQFLSERKRHGFFFPPNPTETTASIGGMVANNASGARSFLYGSVRNHTAGLKLILADGSAFLVERGRDKTTDTWFSIKLDSGVLLTGKLPNYSMPHIKNAAGYYSKRDMDIVDLFIGSEGTLGVITEIELLITPMPPIVWGLMIFLPDEKAAINLVQRLRGERGYGNNVSYLPKPAAIEYFDRNSITLFQRQRSINPALKHLPRIVHKNVCALYVEYHMKSLSKMESTARKIIRLVEREGGDGDTIWAASNTGDLKKLQDLRHAIPEIVNSIIALREKEFPGITKLGTDMAVPDEKLQETIAMYSRDLSYMNLEHIKFGHIGDNHVHVNIMPKNTDEYERGRSLYREWAKRIASIGGTVSAEHGIGKLKRELLKVMYGFEGIEEMKKLKKIFDPYFILNRGNEFSLETQTENEGENP